MSLTRYANNEKLITLNKPATGEVFSTKELQSLKNSLYIPKFTKIVNNLDGLVSEAHIYSIDGDYIISVFNKLPLLDSQPSSPYTIFFDLRDIFRASGITRGSYKVALNLISSVFGQPNRLNEYPFFVKEISPDRTEIQLSLKNVNDIVNLQKFNAYAEKLIQTGTLNNLVLNFGSNRINKITNFRADLDDPTIVYFKLHSPIDEAIEPLDSVWIGYELTDSYIDTVNLTSEIITQPLKQLKGPKFDIDIDSYQSNATIYKSWDDLLSTDVPTTQKILDNAFSASAQATLNIDYSSWENFVFYSSAEERLSNFHYKMGLIESYSIDNSALNSISGSGSYHVITNVSANQSKINTLLESFDSFERWLYHASTGSIFTHDISGSLTPWPKFESASKQINYSATSSIVSDWYDTNIVSASAYDETNYNSLWWSIPEHILMDENNSEYQLFVQMIGHHFDNMYMYVKALTQIHERDEHPQRGPSNDLLPYIAKSFGWNLQNVRQLSDLWLYKLGTDETGSFTDSPDFRITSHKDQTEQVWRRIVNNLPYLLKTKGTARSVKAMMSIYGIPQSLISIKEYGGPGIDNDLPVLIEDTYGYVLNMSNSGSYLRIPQVRVSASLDGWGNLSVCDVSSSKPIYTRYPDTYEFRFRTEKSASLGAQPIMAFASGSGPSRFTRLAVSLVSHKELDSNKSSSYSGSEAYGKILLDASGFPGTQAPVKYVYTDYLPIFDGDLWTVRLTNETPTSQTASLRLDVAKASDSLYGRISHASSASLLYHLTPNAIPFSDVFSDDLYLGGAPLGVYFGLAAVTRTSPHSYNITGSFSGSIQAYKEYYTTYNIDTFYNHVRNPRAYNVDSISGSYYSLYRYLPLGIDIQREDHTSIKFVSSSQPDRTKVPALTEFVSFSGTQFTQYTSINETFYSVTPQIAGQTLGNEKIRLEDSTLKFELSPAARGESSEYDDKPNDRNRLAIVFSTSDQINRDIANHMGAANFDEWIADPEFEFGITYPLLKAKAQEYFQKYTKKYDVNSFIRILSVYDYTFFEQIKQLIPARADLIAGILIEPHMLERNKVQISRLPEVTNPQWSDTISFIPTQSAAYPTYDAQDISLTGSSEIIQFYETASVLLGETVDIQQNYITSSIPQPFKLSENEFLQVVTSSFANPYAISNSNAISVVTSSVDLKNAFSGSYYPDRRIEIQMVNKYDGFSSGSLQLYVSQSVPDCRYTKKTYYYDAYSPSDSYFTTSWLPVTGTVSSGSFTGSITNVVRERLDTAIQFGPSTVLYQTFYAESGSRYILDLYASPFSTSSYVDFTVNVFETATPANKKLNTTIKISYSKDGTNEWINRYKFDFISSGSTTIHVSASANTLLFANASGLYDYLSPWEESWIRNQNRDRKLFSGTTYEPWYYQYNECSVVNRIRFAGSKLEGPGINIDSPNTIDGGPVVEIKQTNPNSIFINSGNTDGNLRIE